MNNKKSSLLLDYVIAVLAYLIMATSMVFINYPKFDGKYFFLSLTIFCGIVLLMELKTIIFSKNY